jgi:hypothetical protein
MRNLVLIIFLFSYIALSYFDAILLGEVNRLENIILAAIVAGIAYIFYLLLRTPKK